MLNNLGEGIAPWAHHIQVGAVEILLLAHFMPLMMKKRGKLSQGRPTYPHVGEVVGQEVILNHVEHCS